MNSVTIRTRLLTAIFLVLGAAACGGGSSEAGPKPLTHHLDDMYIASVPISAKQGVLQAQNEYSLAKMEHAKAKADLVEVGTKIQVARNQQQQALLAERSAQSEKKAADNSADMNRVNKALRQQRIAELERKAADRKVEYLKAKQTALKEYVLYTLESMYAKEASYELAKAQIAHDRNIRPKGFEYGAFERQAQKRRVAAQKAKGISDKAMQVAQQKRKEWQGLIQEAVAAGAPSPAGGAASTGAGQSGGESAAPAPAPAGQPAIKSMPAGKGASSGAQAGGGAKASGAKASGSGNSGTAANKDKKGGSAPPAAPAQKSGH